MKHTTSILALILAAGLLATATPAHAIYIVTPLLIDGETDQADIGDDVDFTIRPHPDDENATRDWAGKTVRVGYSYDKNEGQAGGPDDTVDNSGHTTGTIRGTLTLDDKAGGAFTWTVPQEVDDRNVDIFLEDDQGERLAVAHLAIGDAEPRLYAMSGPSDGEPEIDTNDRSLEEDDTTHEASAVGIFGLIGALGVALLGASQLRRRD